MPYFWHKFQSLHHTHTHTHIPGVRFMNDLCSKLDWAAILLDYWKYSKMKYIVAHAHIKLLSLNEWVCVCVCELAKNI